MVRQYRLLITSAGQASPPELGHRVVDILKAHFHAETRSSPVSVLDVGCGLGHQMALIHSSLPKLFSRIEGVDWSPATIEKHQADASSVYDQVTLCQSDRLPFQEGQFDLAISMENLEHLYGDASIRAIAELARVAKHVLISTPLPQDCINFRWIHPEIVEAIMDPLPIAHRDYICLESAVHKSTLFPSTMEKAGFKCLLGQHAFYLAESAQVHAEQIACVGIELPTGHPCAPGAPAMATDDYQGNYLRLLAESASLNERIGIHVEFAPSMAMEQEALARQQAEAAARAPVPPPASGGVHRRKMRLRAKLKRWFAASPD